MIAIESPPVVTLGQLAQASGAPLWHLRRLFDRGKLTQRPVRIGEVRAILAEEREQVLQTIRQLTK